MKAIGNTPLIKLEHLVEPNSAEIYVKYEGANPTGSMKDRMALSMIEGAERRGQLKPGGRVVVSGSFCFFRSICERKTSDHACIRSAPGTDSR